ncbi:calmodulin-binding receptor-like cytoplasmic kinase 3 isoform X2 [Phoenix dactylifera]|uniref:non-specific serine/threonine protein kinase n=1 Tax=Phoenix dactylifera TaxID=42345 RepID=A0A8B7CBW5_PHODC|nr:calmodulin-binding receptor-like cytoplasmic kinase 3 isoform X2 [Phoenix dactylifera]
MAHFILPLLILVQLPWSLVCGSVPTISKVCRFDHVEYSMSSDGYHLAINQERIEDPVLICEAVETYFNSGCLFCDSQVESWRKIGKQYCSQDFTVPVNMKCNPISVDLVRRAGRKLLLQFSANASNLDQLTRKGQLQEEELDIKHSSASDNVPLAVPGIFLICCAFLCPCFHARRKEASEHNVLDRELNSMDSVSSIEVRSASEKIPTTPLRVPPSPSRFSLSPQLSRIGTLHLTMNQIIKATQSFSPSLRVGEGIFGTVYKAVLPDGLVVAIKRAKKEQIPALRDEFSNEVELLAKVEHRNLVRLLGYNDKGNERIIITEYVPNGTLREHLDGQHGKILDFKQRLEIAIDVAHALTYLHLYAERTIIHRDVKSSNILLTESYRAKVSDFGFARTGPTDTEQTHISTKVKGTAGYLDPEYLRTYQLTPKSDVFSFGILLIEILSGRRPVELKRGIDERITVRWAFNKYNEGNLRDILDPLLEEVVDEEVLGRMLSLAFQCSAPTRDDRPDMKEVGEQLWEIRREFGKSLGRASSSSAKLQLRT